MRHNERWIAFLRVVLAQGLLLWARQQAQQHWRTQLLHDALVCGSLDALLVLLLTLPLLLLAI